MLKVSGLLVNLRGLDLLKIMKDSMISDGYGTPGMCASVRSCLHGM